MSVLAISGLVSFASQTSNVSIGSSCIIDQRSRWSMEITPSILLVIILLTSRLPMPDGAASTMMLPLSLTIVQAEQEQCLAPSHEKVNID
jgi:uncharacterized membrane protein YjdF